MQKRASNLDIVGAHEAFYHFTSESFRDFVYKYTNYNILLGTHAPIVD